MAKPWRVSQYPDSTGRWSIVDDGGLRLVAECFNEGHARDIVRAVNSHETLVSALQGLCPDDSPCLCKDWMVTVPGDKCAYCKAKAALSLAQQEVSN